MKRMEGFIGGLVVGAGLMYVLDPTGGRRRRALIRDKVVRSGHELSDQAGRMSTRATNRIRGMVAETRSRFSSEEVDDSILEQRIRSAMGRVVSNPGAIAVQCMGGSCTISGPVLESEMEHLVTCVSSVRGVHDLVSQLKPQRTPGSVSGLQGTDRGNRRGRDESIAWG